MAEGTKKQAKYESVRIYRDKKKRLLDVVFTRSLKEGKVTEIGVLDEILDKELPKMERKYGVQKAEQV